MGHNSACCPAVGVPVPLGMTLNSAKNFLERQGILRADRCPMPRTSPGWWKVHTIPLAPPLPLPPLQFYLLGDPPPDRGVTRDWPHPKSVEDET